MNVVQKKQKQSKGKELCAQRNAFLLTDENAGGQRNKKYAASTNGGSITTKATLGNSVVKQSSTYVSITSGRGYAHGEVGIACIDIESPDLKLIQLSDDPWYSGLILKLHIIDPCEIILPHTSFDAKPGTAEGKLIKFLREEFPNLSIARVPRRNFNDGDGLNLVKKFCSDKYNYAKDAVMGKYYALSATSGLIKYLQIMHNIFFKENSLKLDFGTKFAHMQIDIDTANKLELLSQMNPNTVKGKYPSLFDVINYCSTSIGKRTLRAHILEPMCDIPSIKEIHDCIDELNLDNFIELNASISHILRNFNNVNRLHKLSMVVPQDDNLRAAEILINQTLHLKRCLKQVPVLHSKLMPLKPKKLREICDNLTDERYKKILDHIETVINPNLIEFRHDSGSQLQQRVDCIQIGVNEIIDVLRAPYKDLITQVESKIGELSSKYGQAFKMNYTVHKGFHAQLMIPNQSCIQDFPDELEVFEIKRNTCYLSTTELNKLNIRIKKVIEEITLQSNVVIAVMLGDIVKEIDAIYDLSGFVATLDVILSLATASSNLGYVCPTFGEEMRIVDAIHPLLEHNIHQTVATPNNVIATPDYNFFVITGPNMSGKTIYIKMIAVLQVMAQLGCYVPAQSAQFRITDRVFSRIGFNDSIQKNASTFVMEMNTMEFILRNITPNSLVIIDELCRSTNPTEGAQLAWNLCEYLCSVQGLFSDGKYFVKEKDDEDDNGTNNMNTSDYAPTVTVKTSTSARSSNWKNSKLSAITAPFVFLTTHYHSLTKLPNDYFNVVNLSFSAEEIENESQRSLKYDHRIKEGVTTSTSYGLALARTVHFPRSVFRRANEIHQQLMSGEGIQQPLKSHKQVLSNVGKELLGTIADSQRQFDKAESLISDAIENTKGTRRRRLIPDTSSRSCAASTAAASTTKSEKEDHLAIDRVLYNLYGDIASIMRKVKTEYEENCGNSQLSDDSLMFEIKNAQNIGVKNFLREFIQRQPDSLIEAFTNLNFTSEAEMSESMNENRENIENGDVTQSDKSETDSLSERGSVTSGRVHNTTSGSSIVSLQDKNTSKFKHHQLEPNVNAAPGNTQSQRIIEDMVVETQQSISLTAFDEFTQDGHRSSFGHSSRSYEDWADDGFNQSLEEIEMPEMAVMPVISSEMNSFKKPEHHYSRSIGNITWSQTKQDIGDVSGDSQIRYNRNAFPNLSTPEHVSQFSFTGSETSISDDMRSGGESISDLENYEMRNFPSDFDKIDDFNTARSESSLTSFRSGGSNGISIAKWNASNAATAASSDSRTMGTHSSKIRRILAPQKSKLTMPKVFGVVSEENPKGPKDDGKLKSIKGVQEVSKQLIEGTETNFLAAQNRLKKLLDKRPAAQVHLEDVASNAATCYSDNIVIDTLSNPNSNNDIIPPPEQFN